MIKMALRCHALILAGFYAVAGSPALGASPTQDTVPLISEIGQPDLVVARADPAAAPTAGPSHPVLTLTTRSLAKGQTLMTVLLSAGIDRATADRAIRAAARHIKLQRLQIGQAIDIYTDPADGRLAGLVMPRNRDTAVAVTRAAGGGFNGRVVSPDQAHALMAGTGLKAAGTAGRTAHSVKLRRGETLIGALRRAGADYASAEKSARVIGQLTNLRKLQVGQRVSTTFAADDPDKLIGVALRRRDGSVVQAGLWPDGRFRKGEPRLADVAATPELPQSETDDDMAFGEIAPAAGPAAPARVGLNEEMHVLRVSRGDTLSELLDRAGAPDNAAHRAIVSLRRYYDSNRLRIGQRMVVRLSVDNGTRDLEGFVIETNTKRAIVVERAPAGRFVAHRASHDALVQAIKTAELLAARRVQPDHPSVAENDAPAPEPALLDLAELNPSELKRLTVARGSTLMETLVRAGCPRQDAHQAIAALRKLFNPRKVRAGQGLTVAFVEGADVNEAGEPPLRLAAITLDVGPDKRVEVVRNEDGGYVSGMVTRELATTHLRVEGTINSSLYVAANKAELPNDVLLRLIRLFSYDVDFQRHIQKGDAFEVLFEQKVDDTGQVVRNGDILYASMTLSGSELPLYRYTLDDGFTDYFNETGQSVRKALMRTPIDGARLTSRFGMRKHPIAGYNKMHRGVDFGAPRGTPIFAAGDGVVDAAGRDGAYGNRIRLRHGPEFKTLYAHLSKFAKGITTGARVRQGQVIGFVGSTGRSTGPHLHYEVWRKGKRVNPLDVKLPTGFALSGTELARFQDNRSRVASLFVELDPASRLAAGTAPVSDASYGGTR